MGFKTHSKVMSGSEKIKKQGGEDRVKEILYIQTYLILKCSEGMKYTSMIDGMVEIEVEATHHYYEVLKQLGTPSPKIDERLEHIMATGMIGAFFEMVLHRMPFDDAKVFLKS